jgi:hypothetical protein
MADVREQPASRAARTATKAQIQVRIFFSLSVEGSIDFQPRALIEFRFVCDGHRFTMCKINSGQTGRSHAAARGISAAVRSSYPGWQTRVGRKTRAAHTSQRVWEEIAGKE